MQKLTKLQHFKNYLNEISSIDLLELNRFIFTKLFLGAFFSKDKMVQVAAILVLVIFGVNYKASGYLFLPQNNLTSFGTFIILHFVMAIVVLLLYPVIIIVFLNYISYYIGILVKGKKLFAIKVLMMLTLFYICIRLPESVKMLRGFEAYVISSWFALYLLQVNMFLNYTKHKTIFFRRGEQRGLFYLFIFLTLKPLSVVYDHTGAIMDTRVVNSDIYLDSPSCELIKGKDTIITDAKNLAINDSRVFESSQNGCFIHSNNIRVGFASDSAILFKRNLVPIAYENRKVNEWVMLSCYYGVNNCFAKTYVFNIKHDKFYDSYLTYQRMEQVDNLEGVK